MLNAKFEAAIEAMLTILAHSPNELDARALSQMVSAYATYKNIHQAPDEFGF